MTATPSTTNTFNDSYTFDYDGLKWTGTIPAGALSMEVHIWGGGGGGGAQETSGNNGVGAGGNYVTHSKIDLTSHVGQSIVVGAGGGGGGGTNGGSAAGGFNGRSITGYSGATGGSSGPTGTSGSGGGGGGASLIKINNIDVVVAGGGGGGGGGGADSQGTSGIASHSASSAVGAITLGENGTPHNGNGGGGGAGGGGVNGGIGGDSHDNDTGANGGYSGSSLLATVTAPATGSATVATGQTPAGSSGGAGRGGNAGASGTNGKVVIIFTISAEMKVKIDNSWKSIKEIKFKRDNIWKTITAGYVKINGVWKAIFNTGFNWQSSAVFGDGTGRPYSGGPGTGPTPAGGGGGGGGCSIICTKLHELGYLSDEIYKADELFGHWLRQTDPNAYYGYLKWARVVVDWMSNEGPQCMFWIKDKNIRSQKQRLMATRWARRIATPWAEHMAYKMGVLDKDNRAGRYIMNIGISVSRLVGRFVKHTNQPTKNVAVGYAMWAMFGVLYLIAGVK